MSEQNNDTIHFESMPSAWANIPQNEPNYKNLYEEMLEKCNPTKYMEPVYDANKVHEANLVYAVLKKNTQWANIKDWELPQEFVELRINAENKLGIQFSTKRLYVYLCKKVDPRQFSGENYHQIRLGQANRLYAELEQICDSWEKLLKIKERVDNFCLPIEEERMKIIAQEQKQERSFWTIILITLIFCAVMLLLVFITS